MVNEQALPVQFVCHTKTYKNYNFQIDGASLVYDSDNWSTYQFWFALSSGVFCFSVWPSFIGAVLSVIKV